MNRSTAHTRRTNTESSEREEKREENKKGQQQARTATRFDHGSTRDTKKKRNHSYSALERKFLGIAVEEAEKAMSKVVVRRVSRVSRG